MRVRLFLAFAATFCSPMPALAHAFLQHASPGAGATFPDARAPQRVVLIFSEKLEPAFSGVTVTDSSGRNVVVAPLAIGGSAMTAPVRPLGPGIYRVAWHVVSVDTHRTEGSYSFKITP